MKRQPIEPQLQLHLAQFQNLEDFRVVVSLQVSERTRGRGYCD